MPPSTNGHRPASFLEEIIAIDNEHRRDRSDGIRGMPPNMGAYPVRHISTFQGYVSTVSSVYREYDEALMHNLDNARNMRNDCGIMESLEARQRATALLNWHIEPEDEHSQEQSDLCEAMTRILSRIRRFTEYRYNLLHAIWYGKYAIQHRYGHQWIRGRKYIMPTPEEENDGWLPINGDKIVFRFETDRLKEHQYPHQVGIRVGPGRTEAAKINDRWKVEATDRGMAYFLSKAERKLLSIHKHSIEDGVFEDPLSAGKVHGVGIRSRIYWDWVQKQESLAFLIEYLERSAGGIELWKYPQGNPTAKAETEQAARERVGGTRNMLLVPVPPGEEGFQYGVEVVEPGLAGIDALKELLTGYFGHRIKRYILGQTLSSEADATGLGSGVAELHWTTFLQIIHYDAGNLEETITNDLLRRLQLWNFPSSAGIHLKFKIDTEKPDQEQRLQALHAAWEMGARIKEADVLEVVGAAVPTKDERTLENPQIKQAEAQTQSMQGMNGQQGMPGMGMPGAQAQQMGNQMDDAPFPESSTDEPASSDVQGMYARRGSVDKYRYKLRDPDLRKAIADAADDTEANPSEAQRESGQYRKGKFHLHGMEISIETPRGATRSGKNRLGVSWSVTMPHHYGYIRRTLSDADQDHLDCFIGPDPESEMVYVVDQQTPGGRFDEHKILFGFYTEREAREAYLGAYSKGWKGLRAITGMTIRQFKAWIDGGDTRHAIESQVSKYDKQGKFEWITIGGSASGDKKHVGGTPVQIDQGGKILKGPSALKNQHVDELGRKTVHVNAKKLGDRWYAMADLPGGKQVTRSANSQEEAIKLASDDIQSAGHAPFAFQKKKQQQALFDPLASPHAAPDPMVESLPGASEPLERLQRGRFSAKVGSTVMSVDSIQVDPQRFQYKISGIDKTTGTNKELKSIGSWNPILAGVVTVWSDPQDGQTYVINGHHRMELAKRAKGQPLAKLPPGMSHDSSFADEAGNYNGSLAVQYIDAATPQEARAMGALANIAEGRGTAIDAAKFMRDAGVKPEEMSEYGISLSGSVARDGAELSNLSPKMFRNLTDGMMSENRALAIVNHLKDPDKQDELWNLIQKAEDKRPLSDAAVSEMARELDVTPTTIEQGGLFGGFERSLIAERAQLKSMLRRKLSSVRNAFRSVSSDSRGEMLEQGGNVIDTEGNRQAAQKADEALYDFDTRVNAKGDPIARAVSDASERLAANPRQQKAIERELLRTVDAIVNRPEGPPAQPGGRTPEKASDLPFLAGRTPPKLAFQRRDVETAIFHAVERYGFSPAEAAELRMRLSEQITAV